MIYWHKLSVATSVDTPFMVRRGKDEEEKRKCESNCTLTLYMSNKSLFLYQYEYFLHISSSLGLPTHGYDNKVLPQILPKDQAPLKPALHDLENQGNWDEHRITYTTTSLAITTSTSALGRHPNEDKGGAEGAGVRFGLLYYQTKHTTHHFTGYPSIICRYYRK